VIGLNKSTTALLEVFLFDIAKGLLGVGSYIIGDVSKTTTLVVYLLGDREGGGGENAGSVVYTLSLGAIPFALERVVRVIAILWLYIFLALAFVLLVVL
jgi:hypothetical protein